MSATVSSHIPELTEDRGSYGSPAEEALAAAGSADADLIVLSTGKHGVASDHPPWRIISHVVRFAQCLVLSVGANFTQR